MQAVKGFISNGVFTPSQGAVIPSYAEVMLVFMETLTSPVSPTEKTTHFSESQIQERIEGLNKIKAALNQIEGEDLSDFPKQGAMKLPLAYAWDD